MTTEHPPSFSLEYILITLLSTWLLVSCSFLGAAALHSEPITTSRLARHPLAPAESPELNRSMCYRLEERLALISFDNERICLPNIKQGSWLCSYGRLLVPLQKGTRHSISFPANIFWISFNLFAMIDKQTSIVNPPCSRHCSTQGSSTVNRHGLCTSGLTHSSAGWSQ